MLLHSNFHTSTVSQVFLIFLFLSCHPIFVKFERCKNLGATFFKDLNPLR